MTGDRYGSVGKVGSVEVWRWRLHALGCVMDTVCVCVCVFGCVRARAVSVLWCLRALLLHGRQELRRVVVLVKSHAYLILGRSERVTFAMGNDLRRCDCVASCSFVRRLCNMWWGFVATFRVRMVDLFCEFLRESGDGRDV